MMNIFKAMSINNDFSINSGWSITALSLTQFYLWIWTKGVHQWLDRLDEGKPSLSEEDVYT